MSYDFKQTMLSFLVYDWDGQSAAEDDFLGSAHICLTLVIKLLFYKLIDNLQGLMNTVSFAQNFFSLMPLSVGTSKRSCD